MFNLAEHRKCPRMAIDCGITYKQIDDPEERCAVAKNISGSGLLFVAEERPDVGTLMEVRVNSGTLSIPPLKAVVEIVRVSPDEQGKWSQDGATECDQFEIAARIKTVK